MQIGRVIGTVVATQKHRKLEGAKLLLVQPLTIDDAPRGGPLLTIDSVGAGAGEKVLMVIEGRAAGEALRRRAAPVDAAIIGIIDVVTIDDEANGTSATPGETARPGAGRTSAAAPGTGGAPRGRA
jgi:ethanolamine utilization protein EutN